jgi:Na+/proline symporter
MLCSLFWRNTNAKGALAGIISGGLTALLWAYLPNIMQLFGVSQLPTIFSLYEIVPAFIVSLIFIFAVSLATGGADNNVKREFDIMRKQ